MKTKEQALKKYKCIATLLFITMLLGFVACSLFLKKYDFFYLKALRAFCEAAMVGALADWFAVTAIFKKPLGINIPHTNLIEKNKNDIGANLGVFVHSNFLTPQALSPYINKIDFVAFLSNYVLQHETYILKQVKAHALKIVADLDPTKITNYLLHLNRDAVSNFKVNELVTPAVNMALTQKYHEKALNRLLPILLENIPKLKPIIKEKINKKAWGFGTLVSDYVSEQLVLEIEVVLHKMFTNPADENRIRLENKMSVLIESLKTNEYLLEELENIKHNLFTQKGENLIYSLVNQGKEKIETELKNDTSAFSVFLADFLKKTLNQMNTSAKKEELNSKIQEFSIENATKNSHYIIQLIQETVEKWDGKELSEKMELEVGKDLQFIRINGTLIGGLVGLLIFYISYILF